MAEDERGSIADFRVNASAGEREKLGLRWLNFESDHPGQRGIDTAEKDVDDYIENIGDTKG